MSTPGIITVTIAGAAGDHAPDLNVNGQTFPLAFNTPVDLPEHAYLALMESTYAPMTAIVSPPDPVIGDGDGAAAGAGGDSGGTETLSFDPEAVIAGTVKQVTEKLAGLTASQLAAVQAAETDREKARAGVLDAVAAALAAMPLSPVPLADNQE